MTTQSKAAAEAHIPVPPEAQLMQILSGCFQIAGRLCGG